MFSIKRVQFVILTRKGISIIAIARWQQQTRYMCVGADGEGGRRFNVPFVLYGSLGPDAP